MTTPEYERAVTMRDEAAGCGSFDELMGWADAVIEVQILDELQGQPGDADQRVEAGHSVSTGGRMMSGKVSPAAWQEREMWTLAEIDRIIDAMIRRYPKMFAPINRA